MQKDSFRSFRQVLKKASQISIITHWSPDGDAMGSSLGLYHYLKSRKLKVAVIVPNEYPAFLHFLPGNDKVMNYSTETAKASKWIQKSDVIFTLDFNALSRIEGLGPLIANQACPKILIDHHQEPESYATHYFHDTGASSTCELVYEFIRGLDKTWSFTATCATCLYTGIMTDTGSFRFPSTSANTHKAVAHLIEAGAKNGDIHRAVYDNSTFNRLRLVGYCLNKMHIIPGLPVAYIAVTEEELQSFHYEKGDTEGLVNYALSIKEIQFSAFFTERDGIIKISFRSKGAVDVNKFARAHFSGGGHQNAAGGKSTLGLNETIEQFTHIITKEKKKWLL